MGMAPLAMYLKSAGVRVEAFDDNFKEPLRTELSQAGIHTLYDPIPVKKPDCIIRSSAIPDDCALADCRRGVEPSNWSLQRSCLRS